MLWHYILIGLVCLIAGFWAGGRNGRRVKRDALKELSTNSLNMLKSKSRFIENESRNINFERNEKLLHVTLQQLKECIVEVEESNAQALESDERAVRSDAQVKKLQQDLITFSRQQTLNQALLRDKAQHSHKLAVRSHERALRATSLVRKATLHIKVNAAAPTQTLTTPDSKSLAVPGQVMLSLIDKPRLGRENEIIKQVQNQVQNRDSAQMAEASAGNLRH
jgi:hypothetical protein